MHRDQLDIFLFDDFSCLFGRLPDEFQQGEYLERIGDQLPVHVAAIGQRFRLAFGVFESMDFNTVQLFVFRGIVIVRSDHGHFDTEIPQFGRQQMQEDSAVVAFTARVIMGDKEDF